MTSERLHDDDRSAEALAFIAEVVAVAERHGFVIRHEDVGGSFEVQRADETDAWPGRSMSEWFAEATEVRQQSCRVTN